MPIGLLNIVRNWVLLLAMAWASIWCCCARQTIAEHVAIVGSPAGHSCCQAKPEVSHPDMPACHSDSPTSNHEPACPFIQARQVQWVSNAPPPPNLRPLAIVFLPVQPIVLPAIPTTFLQTAPLSRARPPGGLVDLHVCLLC